MTDDDIAKAREAIHRVQTSAWLNPVEIAKGWSAALDEVERLRCEALVVGDRAQASLDAVQDRVATIASEAFGPFPVQSVEANLTAIEHGIAKQHREVESLRAENRRLLELAHELS